MSVSPDDLFPHYLRKRGGVLGICNVLCFLFSNVWVGWHHNTTGVNMLPSFFFVFSRCSTALRSGIPSSRLWLSLEQF